MSIFWSSLVVFHLGYSIDVDFDYFVCTHAKLLQSCITFVTLWTVPHQAPLSMGILQARTLKWVVMSTQATNLRLLHRRLILYL